MLDPTHSFPNFSHCQSAPGDAGGMDLLLLPPEQKGMLPPKEEQMLPLLPLLAGITLLLPICLLKLPPPPHTQCTDQTQNMFPSFRAWPV